MGLIDNLIRKPIFVILVFFAIMGCENTSQEGGVNCVNCIAEKPQFGDISIDLTINSENDSVHLNIYKQKYNDNILLADTVIIATHSPYIYHVKANQYFSIKAVYKSGNKIINAIDGGEFNAQEQSGCDLSCWQLVGGKYNVKLKFD